MENQTVETNEIVVSEFKQEEIMMVSPDGKSMVVKDADGKFKRKAIFKYWASVDPQTREEKIALLNLLDSDEIAHPMKDNVGKIVNMVDVIFNPFNRVNEETGKFEEGVLTYLIESDGKAYVTSSKSVYYTLQNAFKAFGEPHYSNEEALQLEIVLKKGTQFKYVDVKVIG